MNFELFCSIDEEEAQPAATMRRQEIVENLKCPVCTELIFPPVMNCRNSHQLCCICLERVSECPMCRAPTESFVVNKFAGDFLEKYVVRCENHSFGCRRHEFKENEATVKLHEESCKYRKIQCWIPNCTGQVLFECLASHWDQVHDISDTQADEESYEIDIDSTLIPSYTTKTFHLKHSSNSFLAIFQARMDTRETSVYVYGYCPKDELHSYQSSVKLDVTINDPNGIKTNTHQWDGPVHHEKDHPLEIEGEKREFRVVLPELSEFQKMHCYLNVKIIPKAFPGDFTRRLTIPL